MSTNYKLDSGKGMGMGRPAPQGKGPVAPGQKPFGAKPSLRAGIKRFLPLMVPEKAKVIIALVAMAVSAAMGLTGPVIIARAIDRYVRLKDTRMLLLSSLTLMGVYLWGVLASYVQIRT